LIKTYIKDNKFYLILSILIVVLTLPQVIFISNTFVDDTFIFLRFARNIVNGHGIVWNIGEEPIAGFTSNIYLLICTLLTYFFSNPILSIQLFNIILAIIGTIYMLKWYNFINPELATENFLIVLIIILSPAFQYWIISGMDALLNVVSLIFYIYFIARSPETIKKYFFFGLFIAILSLIRPEFIFLIFYQTAYLIIKKSKITNLSYMFLGFGILFIPFYIAYYLYFGSVLPNTYFAKTGGGIYQVWGGVEYVFISAKRMFGKAAFILLLILILGFSLSIFRRHFYVLGIALSIIFITVIKGGDHFILGRFLLPAIPLIFILLPSILDKSFSKISKYSNKNLYYTLILCIIIVVNSTNYFYQKQFFRIIGKPLVFEFDYSEKTQYYSFEIPDWTDQFIEIGKKLKIICKNSETLAVVPIGAIGYFSEMRIIDMVGLVDKHISTTEYDQKLLMSWKPGHERGNGLYILSRKPDYILFNDYLTTKPLRELAPHSLDFKSKIEITNDPDFFENYEFSPVKINAGSYLNLYRRKNLGV